MDRKLENINTAVSNLESRVQKLENAQSTTRISFKEMEDGLQEFNTQVNEAKAAGEKVKEHCENKCKELENKLLYAEVYQRRENLRFYGIEEEEEENSLNVLKSFLEQQCGVQREIEFQRVHRIGKPYEDGSPRAIIDFLKNESAKEFRVPSFCRPAERNCKSKETPVEEAGRSKESG